MTQDPADAALVEAVLAAPPRRRKAAAAEVKAVRTASRAAALPDAAPVDADAAIAADVEDDEEDVDLGADPGVPGLAGADVDWRSTWPAT